MSIDLGDRRVEHLLVIGYGISGQAVCRYAARQGVQVTVSDRRCLSPAERARLSDHGASVEDGGHSERALDGVDAVVLSPSVPMTSPLVEEAWRRGLPVYSELDLAALASASVPIVAVTGTNGKSSTVAMIGELLRLQGLGAPVVGNVGAPFIDAAGDTERVDAFVVEASSYQLEQSVAFRPHVGVMLNLEPDHLARHGSMEAYRAAKGRLFRLQTADDVAILPSRWADRFREGSARRVRFDRGDGMPAGAERLALHQQANLRAALCACEALYTGFDQDGIPIDRIAEVLRLPHRMEVVGRVGGVRVIDDSKATNPASTVAALAAVDGASVLLLGGQAKEAGYDALCDAIDAAAVRRIIVFGAAADRLAELLGRRPVERVAGVEQAIRAGLAVARPGDTLLFSPACASFDAYRNFEERGEAFARAVRALPAFSAD